jgi:hypothetical protein
MVLWAPLYAQYKYSESRPTYRRNEKKRAQPRQAAPFVAQTTQIDPSFFLALLCFAFAQATSIPSILRWAVTAREGSRV